MAIFDREGAAERVGKSVDTIRRWERAGWLKFTLGRVREADLLEAEKLVRGRRGRPRKEVVVQGSDVLEEAAWPDGSEADGKAYSLEVSRAMKLGNAPKTSADAFEWVPCEPDLNEPPEFETMTGAYTDVSRRAVHLNLAQQRSGFKAWIFYVAPIEPQGAR